MYAMFVLEIRFGVDLQRDVSKYFHHPGLSHPALQPSAYLLKFVQRHEERSQFSAFHLAWFRAARPEFNRQVFGRTPQNFACELLVVFDVLFALSLLDAVEGWLRNEDFSARDQLLHVPEE